VAGVALVGDFEMVFVDDVDNLEPAVRHNAVFNAEQQNEQTKER
jgi:hypothetical protein